ncbi:alpha/beta fold hydrolase [Micromonospora sp. WMMD1128]|uniref:alpha/beta fold hydrolase n=1 Tax=Micromonospora sp. WMMD1128 TaxID=3015150 RepID=UPI00248A917D|nr:alpha/beta fold hydrolase [Micromonospora sp. WMMD1128]WBB76682.1 alpha/beta fold hydrolase [Micromonospora sp. WMMD1128]
MAVIVLARHVETEKNLRDIHGPSDLASVTARGQEQVTRLARAIQAAAVGVTAVVATPTAQAVVSAQLLAGQLGVRYEGELDLPAIDLGVAAGRSTAELRTAHPRAHRSLDRFRTRVISAVDLDIPEAETARDLERRLVAWWRKDGRDRCPNRLVVGSSSTVLMLAHLLNGVLPSDARYRYLATPNGSARVWRGEGDAWSATPAFPRGSWPDIDQLRIASPDGAVAVTRHVPSWAASRRTIVVIPGYFGSSRHGPYGLYNRLAHEWAWQGFETLTIDPLGSGDSTPVFRDFTSEVRSVEIVAEWAARRSSSLLLVGHSMGGATALRARDRAGDQDWPVWCLAPLCRLVDLARVFLPERQLDELEHTGRTFRHGLELRRDMIDEAGAAWDALSENVGRVWLAGNDRYTAGMDLTPIPPDLQVTIEGADHNFSTNGCFPRLLASTSAALADMVGPMPQAGG